MKPVVSTTRAVVAMVVASAPNQRQRPEHESQREEHRHADGVEPEHVADGGGQQHGDTAATTCRSPCEKVR